MKIQLVIVACVLTLGACSPCLFGAEPAAPGKLPAMAVVKPGGAELVKEYSAKFKDRRGDVFALEDTSLIPPAATPAARPPLTDAALKETLENLGYTPRVEDTGNGTKRYVISVQRGDWTITLMMGLGVDGKQIAFVEYLSPTLDTSKVQARRWQELLEAGVQLAPIHFVLIPATRQVALVATNRNLDLSPAVMKTWIDTITEVTIATHDKWKDMEGALVAPAPAGAFK
ncbi:MAG: hypothetical protein K8T25_12990 [Planctomycetia bacterium]|nr:hypothetical protein [Planctomycetia bacterium]